MSSLFSTQGLLSRSMKGPRVLSANLLGTIISVRTLVSTPIGVGPYMVTGDVSGIKALPPQVKWFRGLLALEITTDLLTALKTYEGHIRDYADQLDQALSSYAGEAIEINKFFYWFSFDVMGHFAFSKSFGMLKGQSWHHAVEMLRRGLALVGPFTPVPWLVRLAFDIPILRVVRDFQSMAAWCAKRMDERIEVFVCLFYQT